MLIVRFVLSFLVVVQASSLFLFPSVYRSLETLLKVYTHVEEEQRKSAINTINLSRNKSVVEIDKSVNLNGK